MKRILLLLFLSLILVGCGTTLSSTPTTTHTTTSSSTPTTAGSTAEVALATPQVFWSDPDTLQWEPIEGATEYRVKVGDAVVKTVGEAQTWLGDLADNAFYEVSVQAAAPGQISLWSGSEEYAKFVPWGNGFDVLYSVLSNQDFSFVLGEVLTVLDIRYQEEEPSSGKTNESIVKSMEGSGFSLGKAFVTEAPEGILEFVVYTTLGNFPLSLSRIETEESYVVNPATFQLFGTIPAFFRFDLMGCTWSSLTGNGITESDYTFADGTLTVSRSFLDPLFDVNPTRNVVLVYYLDSGDDTIAGYLVIHRP